MHQRIVTLIAAAAGLWAMAAHAAPPAPADMTGIPPMPPQPPGLAGQALAQGKVARMLINPYGEVDGLRLVDGTLVKMPPHMSDALGAAVKPGDVVSIIGRLQARGTIKAAAIINTTSGRTVYDEPPPPPGEGRSIPPHLRAQRLQSQQVEGVVDAVLKGPRGEVDGVILADGSIVRFPPDKLRLAVQPGAPFAASGLGTSNAMGTSLEAISLGTSLSALQPLYDREP